MMDIVFEVLHYCMWNEAIDMVNSIFVLDVEELL